MSILCFGWARQASNVVMRSSLTSLHSFNSVSMSPSQSSTSKLSFLLKNSSVYCFSLSYSVSNWMMICAIFFIELFIECLDSRAVYIDM